MHTYQVRPSPAIGKGSEQGPHSRHYSLVPLGAERKWALERWLVSREGQRHVAHSREDGGSHDGEKRRGDHHSRQECSLHHGAAKEKRFK